MPNPDRGEPTTPNILAPQTIDFVAEIAKVRFIIRP
jgi:hypothetical protein